MNANQLAKLVVTAEGKRLSISIAQVKEVLGIVADLLWACRREPDRSVYVCLMKLGKRRAARAETSLVKRVRGRG